jgi:hypothetical protein
MQEKYMLGYLIIEKSILINSLSQNNKSQIETISPPEKK